LAAVRNEVYMPGSGDGSALDLLHPPGFGIFPPEKAKTPPERGFCFEADP
jgi:hypothetical protein